MNETASAMPNTSEENAVNQLLLKEYQIFYESSLQFLKDKKALKRNISFPLLIKPYPEYFKAQKRIMIFGKETYSWGIGSSLTHMREGIVKPDIVSTLLKKYKDFNLGFKRNSPFWNFCHKLNHKFNKSERAFIWNNLSKVDENKTTPNWFILKGVSANSLIINKEINALNPEVVVFLTGSTLDPHLKNVFKGAEFVQITKYVSRVTTPQESRLLPYHTYKTNHPKWLRLNKCSDEVINTIWKEVNKDDQ